MVSRRHFLIGSGALAFTGLAGSVLGKTNALAPMRISTGYGELISDPLKLIDLPPGFSYRVISQLGDAMSDGFHVPDRADGMGCLALDDERVALIRNHELQPKHLSVQPQSIQQHKTDTTYDVYDNGITLPGGTSTLIYNMRTRTLDKQFLIISGHHS